MMRISLNWLNQLVDIETANLEYLLEKLTLGGFEVEELLELKIDNRKEKIIDISATANRADSLSIKGIAKELVSLINLKKKEKYYLTDKLKFKIDIENLSSSKDFFLDCPLFYAVTVENLTNFNSPYWLKQKLFSVGIIPQNNFLDYQNYILVETGYPFEFYDLTKILKKSKTSEVNLALDLMVNKTKFIGNNGFEYLLDKEVLVLKSNENILSIAGILSNKDFSYTKKTHSLLIEGAIYNPQKIRKTSRLLNLRTDRSARYEKSLTDSDFIEAFYRLILLLKILNPQLICKLITGHQKNDKNNSLIELNYKNINNILGSTKEINFDQKTQISVAQISNYLTRLNCTYTFSEKTLIWQVKVPNFRSDDITREIDLIEEIGRLYGFNAFMTCLPKTNRIGWKDFSYEIRKKMTACFLNEGLNELINYSFIKSTDNNSVQLLNPLLIDSKNLRNTLLPNIIQTISETVKQININIEGFEFGHVFSTDKHFQYKEVEFVAGILGNIPLKRTWSENSNSLSWFEAKGKIEDIFHKLNLSITWKTLNTKIYDQLIHPYRGTELYLNNEIYLGVFGQIHPIIAQNFNISSQLFLFEFNFELIKNELKRNKFLSFKAYSLYPKIFKDLSFIVDKNIAFEKIKSMIMLNGTPYLIQVNLLDEYQGKLIPTFCTSLCIQLVFQSSQKTLVTKEIEEIVKNIETIVIKNFNAEIRV
uniref:Phenylalanine--tRNA ligase beta subunit, chloroplastic n=1 Tax=Actinocyclus subtilis TaxID=1630683 RepID=A0A2U9NQG6_9STRA|nr:phenylalanine-tRNA ligase beta subunit [Actinocyclus subtilis]AWT39282.1 phenylalanine-tRNA ligase beta subunit [Actinocyclus subtilis]